MDLIKLGELLKDKRNELKLSLRDAGEMIGISHNYLSILEKAKDPRSNAPIKPTIETLKLISDSYKIDVQTLLDLAGYENINVNPVPGFNGKIKITIPEEFTDPKEARQYIGMHAIFGSEGFRLDTMDDDEVIKFANELLRQMELISYKYKK